MKVIRESLEPWQYRNIIFQPLFHEIYFFELPVGGAQGSFHMMLALCSAPTGITHKHAVTDSNCEAASLIVDPDQVRDILPGSFITEIDGDICACSEHHCNTPSPGLSECILQQSNYSKYKFMQLFDFLVGISAQGVTFRPIMIVIIINI